MTTNRVTAKAIALFVSVLILLCSFSVIGVGAVVTEDGFEYYSYGDYVEIRGYAGTEDEIVIPATIDELPVKSIGSYAFRDETTLKRMVLPDSITEIESGAFSGCENLEEVNIPQGVTYINSFTFTGCEKLEYLPLDDRILGIGKYAFASCESLKNIYIPQGIACVEEWTFFNCKSLKKVNIPQGVKSIGNTAFSACASLKEIVLPEGLESIGDSAFSMCKSLESVVIGEGVKSIGEDAFRSCEALKTVSLPSTLSCVEVDAFSLLKSFNHVLYAGSLAQWKQINLNSGNDCLHTVTRHYDACADMLMCEVVKPTCCEQGYTLHYCSLCEFNFITDETDFTEHTFLDGVCSLCSVIETDLVESEHNYSNNLDNTYTVSKPKAESVTITFSSLTQTEEYYDYIYIYDGNDVLFGKYTGGALASKSITVKGDAVKIRLVTDEANTAYGFSLVNVTAVYPEQKYSLGDVNLDSDINIKDATAIQKHIAMIEIFNDDALELADFDTDDDVNIKDATAIQKFIAGIVH